MLMLRLVRRRLPAVYRVARASYEVVANALPPRLLPPVPGPVSRADLMVGDRSLVTTPAGDAVAHYHRTGAAAAEFLVEATRAAGRTPASVGRVLDVGCGHGRVTRHLAHHFPTAVVVGCDLDRHAVAFCRRHLAIDARVVGTDPSGLPGGPFDLVWMGSVVTHLPDVAASTLVREVVARLRPDGVLAFSTHDLDLALRFDDVPRSAPAEPARGHLFVPYPYSAGGDYGLAFHDPGHVRTMVSTGFGAAPRELLHCAKAWSGAQDLWAFAPA